MSPAMHNQATTNIKMSKNQGSCNVDESSKQIEPKKGYSPSINAQKITQFFSNHNHSQSTINENIKNKDIVHVNKAANINRSP